MKGRPRRRERGAPRRPSALGFLLSVPVGLLGGLIGLGGAEFRLPLLCGPLGYPVRRAVPLNLAVSLVTLATALAVRARTLSLAPLRPLAIPLLALAAGAIAAAFWGAALATRIPQHRLERVIVILLVAIGCALVVESLLPTELPGLLPAIPAVQAGVGLLLGAVIGAVSSLLGVAGGELLIPTLVFAFGADITTAGTGSLAVSIPTVIVGLARYVGRGALRSREEVVGAVLPLSAGSLLGAAAGGWLAAYAPQGLLKAGLGCVLIVSALRMFAGSGGARATAAPSPPPPRAPSRDRG